MVSLAEITNNPDERPTRDDVRRFKELQATRRRSPGRVMGRVDRLLAQNQLPAPRMIGNVVVRGHPNGAVFVLTIDHQAYHQTPSVSPEVSLEFFFPTGAKDRGLVFVVISPADEDEGSAHGWSTDTAAKIINGCLGTSISPGMLELDVAIDTHEGSQAEYHVTRGIQVFDPSWQAMFNWLDQSPENRLAFARVL